MATNEQFESDLHPFPHRKEVSVSRTSIPAGSLRSPLYVCVVEKNVVAQMFGIKIFFPQIEFKSKCSIIDGKILSKFQTGAGILPSLCYEAHSGDPQPSESSHELPYKILPNHLGCLNVQKKHFSSKCCIKCIKLGNI